MLEKKYCIHCRTLYSKESICGICGKSEFQDIKIMIHHQEQSNRKKILAEHSISCKLA